MKRRPWNFALLIGALLVPSSLAWAQLDDDDDDESFGAREPVQIYLTASITDHINLDITEDRIRRVLGMLDKYRNEHPEAHIMATILFSGAVSEALADRNPRTHIVDFVKDFAKRGLIEIGYDGTDEPTYKARPIVEFKTEAPEDRWRARAAAAEKFLTEWRDPVTGAVQPDRVGGLKKMQDVFGGAAAVTGITLGVPTLANVMPDLGSDVEAVHQLRRYNSEAVLFGLPDENPLHSVAYRGWTEAFGKDLSPYPITPPELFWQDGVLRTSESIGRDNQLFLANMGAAAFSYVIKMLDRNKVRVIHIELGNERNYLTKKFRGEYVYPPTKYAYAHPDHPQLPAEAFLEKDKVDAAFATEDELLDWLADDFIPDHPGSRFLSNASLKRMTPRESGYDLRMNALRSAVSKMLNDWGDRTTPPKYLLVNEFDFLSLAQTFQVLADALAEQSRTGKLPEAVRVAEVHGPLEIISDVDPVLGEVSTVDLAKSASGLVANLHDNTWQPVPSNVVPTRVKVDGLDLNPAQFLRLMAEALLTQSPDAKLKAKPCGMFATQDFLGMRTRAARDMGVVWTYKPAVLLLNDPVLSAAK